MDKTPANKLKILILGLPRTSKRIIVLIVDIVICILATIFAYYLRLGSWDFFFDSSAYTALLPSLGSIVIAIPIFIKYGLYREIFRHSGWTALYGLIQSISFYAFIYFFIFTIVGVKNIPRTIGLIQPIVLFILIGASRAFASYWLSNDYRRELSAANISKVLIYGAGNAGMQLAAALSHSKNLKAVGFLDDDPAKWGQYLLGREIYAPNDLSKLVMDLEISSVLLAIPSVNRYRRNEILKFVRAEKVSIQTTPNFSDLALGKASTQEMLDLDIDDLLMRNTVLPDPSLLNKNCYDKTVLITGAGGSIGGEICRQVLTQLPKTLVLIDQNEYSLYQIHHEIVLQLVAMKLAIEVVPILTSVANVERMHKVISKYRPDIIYHSAAYKHVPLVQSNLVEGLRNNVIGTFILAKVAIDCGTKNFVLISTDKAVRPTNIMGASKRLAEMILQALGTTGCNTIFAIVRFGNVLNSSGSVVPLFRRQIKDGGPVTITDYRITRYFMTIAEASQLVIQAGALAKNADIFLLDMGESIKIIDLARRMIELSGFTVRDVDNPNGDIEIREIGLRPGEKLYEELLIDGTAEKTIHPKIFKSIEVSMSWKAFEPKLTAIIRAIDADEEKELIVLLQELVAGYTHQSKTKKIQ